MGLRFFCLLCVLATPRLAAAQGPRVVVVAPEPLRAPLCEALAVELSSRGAAVCSSLRPTDGDFVVALREGEAGYDMVLTANRTGRELRSHGLDATDAHSLAVVAASLLDEALEPGGRARGLDAPPPPEATDQEFFDEPLPPAEPPDGAEHALMFGASIGGAYLFGDDLYSAGGGPLARLRLGWRFRNLLRVAASVEGSFISQEDPGVDGELQPMLMACLEASVSLELAPITGHLGARGCVTLREYDRAQFIATSSSYRWGRVPDVLSAGYGAGGFLAASVYTSRAISLWLRADVLVVETDFGDWPGVDVGQGASVLGTLTFGVVVE